jgi:hypothetical protein
MEVRTIRIEDRTLNSQDEDRTSSTEGIERVPE